MPIVSAKRADRPTSPDPAGFRPTLELRARVQDAIRNYFGKQGFLEVETPVRIRTPALERHIDALPAGGAFLRTSPELHMKRMLASGYERIFQIGPCFRAGEQGALHHSEFTMLEWYRADADYRDVLSDAEGLVQAVVMAVHGGTEFSFDGLTIDVGQPWERHTVADAFLEHAGWDPTVAYDEDRFTVDLVEKVEPRLPHDRAVVLKDYPAGAAALARCRPGTPPVAERWELYLGGLELANAFSELTDAAEQRHRFEQWSEARRLAGQPVYDLDEPFLSALEQGMPPSGGVALGVDRLVMLLADQPRIDRVRPFLE
jgi:lysyl-tRNA synthetase class 2